MKNFWCVKYYKAQPYNMEHTLCVCKAHTQRIESMWAAAKLWRRIHGYKAKDGLQDYLNEFCYRYNHEKSFDYIWKNLYR